MDLMFDSFEWDALVGHGPHLKHLIHVLLRVTGMAAVALMPIHQTKLYVVTDRSERQICQRTQLVQGESGVHAFILQ